MGAKGATPKVLALQAFLDSAAEEERLLQKQ